MSLVVVAPVEEIPDEFAGREWPLHITVTTNFETSLSAKSVIARVAQAGLSSPFAAVPGLEDFFGPDRDIRVIRISPPSAFVLMHHRLVDALDPDVAWVTPEYLRENYQPHCTVIRGRQMHGEVLIDRLVLIDNAPNGDPTHRRVLGRFLLG